MARTYNEFLNIVAITTKAGTTYTVSDTIEGRPATALLRSVARKEQLRFNYTPEEGDPAEVIIPWHAVQQVVVTSASGSVTYSDTACTE